MGIDLFTIDWTAISAISSTFMVVLTYIIIRQNRFFKKAILTFEIQIKEYDFYLDVTNVGESVATNLKLKFGDELLSVASGYSTILLHEIQNGEFTIKPHERKSFPLEKETFTINSISKQNNPECNIIYNYLKELRNTPIKITGSYKTLGMVIKIDESFTINNFRITDCQ